MSEMHFRQGSRCLIQSLITVLVVFLYVFCLPVAEGLGLEMPQTLIEKIGTTLFSPKEPIPVQAMVSDPIGIFAVRCYFRYREGADFVFIGMEQKENGIYQGILPAPAEDVQEVEFLFLTVNSRRQVVRTPMYTAQGRDGKLLSLFTPTQRPDGVKTDLIRQPETSGLGFASETVSVLSMGAGERYGLVAGLYRESQKAKHSSVAESYFGAFELRSDGKYIPIKGEIDLGGANIVSTEKTTESLKSTSAQSAPEIIGPDIAGDTWEGLCYYGYGEGSGQWLIWDSTPVTAIVTHESDQVTITLSTPCSINYENIGHYFNGTMDAAGNMLLVDERVPQQAWSSHWGPATESYIKIGDYVTVPNPDNPFPDYYVIELQREYPPPKPPDYSYMQAVYHLLLTGPQ